MASHQGPFTLDNPPPRGVQITRLPPAGFKKGQKARSPKEYQGKKKLLDLPTEPEGSPKMPAGAPPTPPRDQADALRTFREQNWPAANLDFAPAKRTENSYRERGSFLRMMFGDKPDE